MVSVLLGCLSAHPEATIDRENSSGDVARLIGGEEGHCRSDFIGLAHAAERHGTGDRFASGIVDCGEHVGGDWSRGDDVDCDISRCELTGQRSGKTDKSGFRCGVVGLSRLTDRADD